MPYTDPTIQPVGHVVTSAEWNRDLVDNFKAIATAAGLLLHEAGGIEADISAIAAGGLVRGTGAGTMGILARGAALRVLRVNAGGTNLEYRTFVHTDLGSVSPDQHHAKAHAISGAAHTGVLTDGQIPAAIARDSELHAQAHTAASHSDQGATGAELETLTDGSETTLHSHANTPTREFFVLAVAKATAFPYAGTVGDYAQVALTSAQDVDFLFHMPADFTTLVDAVVVTITDNTETLQWDVLTDFAGDNEFFALNSDSIVNATEAVQNDVIEELDVSAALTGLAAGDYVGMKFASDTTQIRVIGLRIKYS